MSMARQAKQLEIEAQITIHRLGCIKTLLERGPQINTISAELC